MHLIRRNRFMQGHGNASRIAHDNFDDHAPITPRGMAAPPPQAVRRIDVDPGRPATIRIEANTRPLLTPRREPESERTRSCSVPVKAAEGPAGRMHALVLSQGLLLNAFVLLMVFGWASPLPGRRYLLGAFAIGGIVVAILIHLALRAKRSDVPARPRTPTPRTPGFSDRLHTLAVRGLPAVLVTGWATLGLYSLALPPTASAFQEGHPATGAPQSTPAAAPPGTRPAMPAASKPADGATSKDTSQPARHAPFRT
jgi:hypothetical protein